MIVRDYVCIFLPADLVTIVGEYLVPVLASRKCIEHLKPTSFSISPDGSTVLLIDTHVVILGTDGLQDLLQIGIADEDYEDYENEDMIPFTYSLALNSSTHLFGNSKSFTILSKDDDKKTHVQCGVVGMCATPQGDIVVMDLKGRIVFYSMEGILLERWKVRIDEFDMKTNSCFAVLPNKCLAVASATSPYLVFITQGQKVVTKRWRNGHGFVQIFYSKGREEIMLFDRHRQLICCCDMSGNRLYDITLHSHCTSQEDLEVEEVFIREDKITLLEREKEDYHILTATIIG